VLWFPNLFAGAPGGASLACYHANLTFATLQVDSLGGLVRETAEKIRNNTQLAFAENECARFAGGLLGRFHGGQESVYRSWSTRVQIQQSNGVDDIDAVRAHFKMKPLA
jgi:hypothetical protein